ncbi:MAG: ABC transporter ATP-binding protein [bacterium]|nr:ABC transporter ATP-binding protein [bacterium]MCP4963761.1 ABC transporter ATP-binding protein [bacterium]
MASAVLLEGITKRFPGVIANDGVNLDVAEGEIHAICGENGAGKSTLMKILYGMQPADEGRMVVNGQEVKFSSPKEAIALGIGMVHQHFMLADNLSVLENVILGAEPAKNGIIDFPEARRHIIELGEDYGLKVGTRDLVESLEVGERQRIEIIKVLFRGAKILILDEPTAVLVPQEVEELFRNMRELKANGHTIIFIDHKLDEVLEIADTITVIRAGKTIDTVKPEDVTARDLAELMVGSELPVPETRESTVTDHVVIEAVDAAADDDAGSPKLRAVSMKVHKGEILGIAGVEGNGQAEFVEALMGMRPLTSGSISLEGVRMKGWGTRQRREAGIGYIPEDRTRRGLLAGFPLWENAMLGQQSMEPYVRNGFWIQREAARSHTGKIVEQFDVRTPSVDVAAHALSGGNQQKLIVGREMSAELVALIAAHPTRGIDVGAQAAVWEELRQARATGLAVILISADLEELIGLSDRLVVMLRGDIVAELDPTKVTPRDLGSYMTGASTQGGES